MGTEPTRRDPARTKQRILAAALAAFAAKGFAGARVDEIAEDAGVNKRMLYHYFGDKRALWEAVYRAKIEERRRTAADQPEDLLGSLPYWFRVLIQDRDWIRMLAWEALEEGSAGVVAGDERAALYADSLGWAERAKATGSTPSDIDPDLLLLVGFALNLFPFAFPQVTLDITGSDPSDPAFQARYEEALESLARRLRT